MICFFRKKWPAIYAVLIFSLMPSGPSFAHTMAPVLITITQVKETEYNALWSFSRDTGAIDPARLSLAFKPGCQSSRPAILTAADNRWLRDEYYRCEHLQGQRSNAGNETLSVVVNGLQLIDTSVVMRVVDIEKHEQIHLMDERSDIFTLTNNPNDRSTFSQYLILGVEHILGGADHLLFVVALCFLASGAIRTLIGLVTAFTVAHSITLTTAVLGWVSLASRPVEALIALSIALIAADLVKNEQFSRKRILDYWPVVFIFGLLHGLGFAGALAEIGLPQTAFLTALLAFNLGVELGQLGVVLLCAILIQMIAKIREPTWLNPVVGVGIGCTAGFWFVARVV